MGSHVLVYGGGLWLSLSRRRCRIVSGAGGDGGAAWRVLEQVDEELSKGDERAALGLVRDLQGKPGGLRCFGAAPQIPQRLYTRDELRLNGIETSSLLSPVDATLGSIERGIQAAAVLGGIAAWNFLELSPQQIFFSSLGLLFLWTLDAVTFNGGISFLVLDTLGHLFSQKYHNRVVQHEAGHFLIAYLLGILPKGYTLTSLEALKKEGSLNVQAGTAFVDFEFLEEVGKFNCQVLVSKGKVSATTLNRFSCIALAGVATEYLLFGAAEGGLADINTLDRLLKSLGFTQKKADAQVRWAVLNTVLLLRRHEKARAMLAEAMSEGQSVSSCVQMIEKAIDVDDL
ncbi:stress regulated protein [Striga asiatica]|uniref:Stress regulated protein n=1 Tax=Striga asiatica TaxID=4170 RepID=A0A5A7PT32_STRAF|nr:stress regulated protein [Striga asiatica]